MAPVYLKAQDTLYLCFRTIILRQTTVLLIVYSASEIVPANMIDHQTFVKVFHNASFFSIPICQPLSFSWKQRWCVGLTALRNNHGNKITISDDKQRQSNVPWWSHYTPLLVEVGEGGQQLKLVLPYVHILKWRRWLGTGFARIASQKIMRLIIMAEAQLWTLSEVRWCNRTRSGSKFLVLEQKVQS